MTPPRVGPVDITWNEVFPSSHLIGQPYLSIDTWNSPITYFVGRNGSGKSRAGKQIANKLSARYLGADRLTGMMSFLQYGFGSIVQDFRGAPLGEQEREQLRQVTSGKGTPSTEYLYVLRDQPAVWLRVAAFIRRALHRTVDLRESAGYLDPYVHVGGADYSLFRDEGHGLRELVLLLAAVYREDWDLLVVDEPELNLHPSLTRIWLSELERICVDSGRRAIIITHQPDLIRPSTAQHLESLLHFAASKPPQRLIDAVLPAQHDRVASSLLENPTLVSQLVFSPRPVLVEGITDVAALSTALNRSFPAEVVAQTDLVPCGGSGGVSLWFEVCRKLSLDVRAVGDLDACFAADFQRAMDATSSVVEGYRRELAQEPPRTSAAVRDLIVAADGAGVEKNPARRAEWLASADLIGSGHGVRLDKLLAIWKDAGFWLHRQGDLEGVLGTEVKGVPQARDAAAKPGTIDSLAEWVAYKVDTRADVEALLNQTVERIAHDVMHAQRLDADIQVHAPLGSAAESDARLVRVEPGSSLRSHRITVYGLASFDGYWLEFTRETPASELLLRRPIA